MAHLKSAVWRRYKNGENSYSEGVSDISIRYVEADDVDNYLLFEIDSHNCDDCVEEDNPVNISFTSKEDILALKLYCDYCLELIKDSEK